jgi:hypothetical protein
MGVFIDLTGKSFHKLKVLNRADNAGERIRWLCLCECGNTKVIDSRRLRYELSKSCGCERDMAASRRMLSLRGEKSFNWRGGSHTSSIGYKMVWAPEHPKAKNGRYMLEHRLIMERKLGRYLTDEETVHHKNGDRLDNREENLELWSTQQPSGQRVSDKIEFALEILALYRPESLAKPPVDNLQAPENSKM